MPLILTLFGCFAAFASCQPAAADELPKEQAPVIRAVLRNSELVFDRLNLIFNLTSEAEKEQQPIVKDFIDVFLYGVDRNKPIRLDVLTNYETTEYLMFVPVEDFRTFWKENLDPLAIPVRSYPGYKDFFKLGGGQNDAFTGWMRYEPGKRSDYAAISEKVEDIPANMPDPLKGIEDLLKSDFDALLDLTNKAGGVRERHSHFRGERERFVSQLKRDTNESAEDFALRQFAAGFQFDAMEQYYAEAEALRIGMKFSESESSGQMSLKLKPLAGTTVAQSVAQIGTQTSRFAGIPRGSEKDTTGRMLFPLDDFYQKNLTKLVDLTFDQQKAAIAANATKSDAQKKALTELVQQSFARIKDGIASGWFDGFLEMQHAANGPSAVVGGLRAADGTKWIPVLELIPQAYADAALKLNTGEHEGVTFHDVTLSAQDHKDFFEIFGDGHLLVGTAADSLWYAAGPDAEARLKAAISAAKPGDAKPDMSAISFHGEMKWWITLLDGRLGDTGFDEYRKLALDAFQGGEGRLFMELKRDGETVLGDAGVDRGMLRLLGKGLAKFSLENLN